MFGMNITYSFQVISDKIPVMPINFQVLQKKNASIMILIYVKTLLWLLLPLNWYQQIVG